MKPIPAFPPIPESDAEVREIFGDIRDYILADGTLSETWERKHVVRIALPTAVKFAYGPQPISFVTVHTRLAEVAQALYASIWEKKLENQLGPYGGGFVFRPNANSKTDLSLHAYAIAWDWNPREFPNGSAKKRAPELVAEFERFGFLCGQNFRGRKDPMHFQFARNT